MRRLPLRSPPRVRGKVVAFFVYIQLGGITPAYAGKRRRVPAKLAASRDHPRVCGEKHLSASKTSSRQGSPPRMRGKVLHYPRQSSKKGITPAYAGKSRRLYRAIGCSKGSPPRMRGKAFPLLVMPTQSRITPAYAGKRGHRRFGPGTIRDHPRVCGEKGSSTFWSRNHSGSPPRMRGKVLFKTLGEGTFGITPACAGKRHWQYRAATATRDHPRVCGEKRLRAAPSHPITGSPPRVWGKGQRLLAKNPEFGITPACAGKRMVFAGRKSRTWDHPRVCGEKVSSTSPIKCLKGSPPRMRGKVPQPGVEGCRLGITPAYAGKRGIKLSIASMIWDHPRVCGEKLITLPIAR